MIRNAIFILSLSYVQPRITHKIRHLDVNIECRFQNFYANEI